MGQQLLRHANRQRSFTSISTIGCSDGIQISGAQCTSANCTLEGGNSSKSFHNFGRNDRISSVPKTSYRNEGLFEVSVDKHLLEPLYLGVDLHDHQIKAHEKDQMKDLNTQFACFIDKVRDLEQRNEMLVTKWELLQNQKIPIVKKDLNPLLENYISSLRKKLDCMLNEKNKLGNQQRTMQDLTEEYRCRYKEEAHRKAHVENEFVLLKQEVDNAFKEQKKLELKKELLIENKEFLKIFFAEELAVLNCHLSDISVVLNMNNTRCLDMDNLIQNIDSWYQSIAQRSKEEANIFYQNQIVDLQNKKCQCHESLQKNSDEIAELNRLIQIMQCKADAEKKMTAALQVAIGDAERNGDRALKEARAKHVELQNRMQSSKDQLASILRDYQDLMNTKLALDIEIATYKTMLEGEENRIRTGGPMSLGKESEHSSNLFSEHFVSFHSI
ncbi:LOW QUALITY PROTEIN: keratin, type II cytoskeletal 5-like [Candoia aspera]|uniref:LOW QUALITY PROTEIN: keratin, type II cytoskeletal 5-like n=1 Tax=Candoia aspera TaxID=51853 RepID=UPI002FD7DC87